MPAALLALLTLQAAPVAPAQVRTVQVAITDAQDRPVEGLVRDELAVLENGVARDIVRVEADRRPLSVAIVIDSSQELGSIYRLYLVDAVTGFLRRLPAGARFALWTSGDRPRRILELGDDRGAAAKALKRVIPQGGNTLFDALAEASQELKKREGERTAVVAVTGRTTDFSNRDRYRAAEDAERNADAFHFLAFDEGQAPFEARTGYDYVMDRLTKNPGGRLERPLSAMAAPALLLSLAGDLSGAYRVSYATLPELKERKLEIQVARPGVKIRLGRVSAETP